MNDEVWMAQALQLAEQAAANGEVPVGAVIVKDNQRIAAAYNQPITRSDPTGHAEILALRQAAITLNNYRLPGSTLYVTLEPCCMCLGAMIHARVERLVFGALEPRAGAVESQLHLLQASCFNHKVAYTAGILADQSRDLLQHFFRAKRQR